MATDNFSFIQFELALTQFLRFGNDSLGIGHKGYFSKGGWAWECLSYYLSKLEEIKTVFKLMIIILGKLSEQQLEDMVGEKNTKLLSDWYFKNRAEL